MLSIQNGSERLAKATQLVLERQNQVATADTSELSSFSLSELPVGQSGQQEANAENCTQLPYHAHLNDILTEYPAWSTDANDIENTNQDQYRSGRQEILIALQKDTTIKTPDNRQVLDNLEAYVQDKLSISRSLHDRLGLTVSQEHKQSLLQQCSLTN